MTTKNIHKILITPKIFIFLKTQNIEIQNSETPNMVLAYVKILEYRPPLPPGFCLCPTMRTLGLLGLV